jgi:peptidoglycan/xylan/chitin deacetylase (PgdA/CDA1 family)
MTNAGYGIARRGVQILRHRLAHRALILLYHRIVELPSDPFLLSVTPQNFCEHLQVIRRYAQPMSLQGLTECLQNGGLPRKAVVITFDDGYADNLYNAKPILEQYGIPATVFVTAGQIGSQQEFWWDELERLLLLPNRLPEITSLSANSSPNHWAASVAELYLKEDDQRDENWHIEQASALGSRQAFFHSLYELIHAMTPVERREAVRKLQTWASVSPEGRSSHRVLSAEEVIRLAEGGLIEVGAHTMAHPSLAALPAPAQAQEIQESQARLEEILNRRVLSIAYPHGSFTQETLRIVRGANYRCACCSDTDAVWRGTDPYLLPRVGVRNWSGGEFTRWLKGWLGI